MSQAVPETDHVVTAIRRIWNQVLGVSGADDADDFFDLGGSSVDALVLLRMLEAELATEFPLADFYDTPTIEALAERARRIGESPEGGA
ncbi:acyl carrier protein [Streptosporangium sp. NPDC003464]